MERPKLDDERLAELALRARAGDVAARNEIVEANLQMVRAVAWKSGLTRRLPIRRNRRVGLDDMVQEGYMALIRSVVRWDCSRGAGFLTYSGRLAYNAMSKWVGRHGSRGSGMSVSDDRATAADDMDKLVDSGALEPLDRLVAEESSRRVADAFNGLPPRDRELLVRRHGLDGRPPRCDEALAFWMGTTPSMMRKAAAELERRMADSLA